MPAPSVAPGLAPPWWLEEALAAERAARPTAIPRCKASSTSTSRSSAAATPASGRRSPFASATRRFDRSPREGDRRLGARAAATAASCTGTGRTFPGSEGPARRRCGALELARISEPVVPAVRAFCASPRRGRVAARGRVPEGLGHPFPGCVRRPCRERPPASSAVPEECVPLDRDELCRAGALDGVSSRRPLPRRRNRPAGSPRTGAEAGSCSPTGLTCTSGRPSPGSRRATGRCSTPPGGRVRAAEVVVATNAWMAELDAGRRPADELRLLHRHDRARARAPGRDRLDGRAVDLATRGCSSITSGRRPTVGSIMGSGSGPIGLGGRIDARFWTDGPTAARAEDGLRTLLPAAGEARVEAAWGGPIDVSADHLPFFGTVPGRPRPLRRRLFRQRRRGELDRRSDPGLAGDRGRRRMDGASPLVRRRVPAPTARAASPARRRRRSLRHPGLRGARRGRAAPAADRSRCRPASRVRRNPDRHSIGFVSPLSSHRGTRPRTSTPAAIRS